MGNMLNDEQVAALAREPRRRSYPWDQWANGKWWHLKPGEDFDCKPVSFPVILNAYARRHGLRAEIRRQPDGSVFVVFVPR